MADSTAGLSTSSRKAWRKLVKKLRRKRIRQKKAVANVTASANSSPDHLDKLLKARLLEEYELEQEAAESERCHQLWLDEERRICAIWREKQEKRLEHEREQKAIQKKIRDEWEAAKKRKEEKALEEKKKRDLIDAKIETFIKDGGDIPSELLYKHESNPSKEPCPFFSKVAACRFGGTCSRNHVVPGISRVLLIPGFYSHFTLYQNRSAEYDTDVGLEFEDSDTYRDFREFFEDVVSELQQWNGLRIVQVCRNSEPHLRGNFYVEYSSERAALAVARALNARWYGGKQLTVQFVRIPDWGSAICGDFKKGRCPKGPECNFLHVFRNPRGLFLPPPRAPISKTPRQKPARDKKSLASTWRWSESPERRPRSTCSVESDNDRWESRSSSRAESDRGKRESTRLAESDRGRREYSSSRSERSRYSENRSSRRRRDRSYSPRRKSRRRSKDSPNRRKDERSPLSCDIVNK